MNYDIIEINPKVAAVFTIDSAKIFDTEELKPEKAKKGYRGYVPWGEENNLPQLMLEKIRVSEVMSQNMFFNTLSCYGNGFSLMENDAKEKKVKEVKYFFRRNNPIKYFFEQTTDIKYFYLSICILQLTNDGEKVARIKHKEVINARFEVNNPKTGKIENVFFANWPDNPDDKDIQVYPVLDQEDPYWDLMVRMGKEPDPATGNKRKPEKSRVFAIVTRIPTPGHKYYPIPTYAAHFKSGYYDIGTMIPIAKKAKMTNGMMIKYHVEFHKDYFETLYKNEAISDPVKRLARQTKEYTNIKEFISGVENSGKVWFSGYFQDQHGKEQRMVRINVIDTKKEGGDYIEDMEEISSIQCYVNGVHPSIIGAVPGKSKGSFSGSDKRELFTMKQSMEKIFRDLLLIPYTVIQEYNQWPEEIEFEIPHLMLTTLDQGTDAKIVSPQIIEPDDSK